MYQIGNVVFEVTGLALQNVSSRLELFRCPPAQADAVFHVRYTDSFAFAAGYPVLYSSIQFAVMQKPDGRKLYCYIAGHSIHAVLEETSSRQYTVHLSKSYETCAIHPYFFPSLLGLERLLINRDALILHSSCVAVKGASVLFTAPSGGGKSTQAALWRDVKGAHIVNGDKNVVACINGKWESHGLPFSGSSDDCLNESHPIAAIVILSKAPENRLQLVGTQGFSGLFSQITLNPWDRAFCTRAMDLAAQVCSEVPVYHFSCTRTPAAVEVLWAELAGRGAFHGPFK